MSRSEPAGDGRQSGLRSAVAGLSPAYFAMVMATGIVSIAALIEGMPRLASALFILNIGLYAVLWLLTLLRLAWYPRRLLADLVDHKLGPGFFTTVAGSCVLGSQSIAIAGNYEAALALWALAALLWVGLTYTIFTAFSVKAVKPSLAEGINGGWLLAVVAVQAIAMLATMIAAHWPQPWRLELNFLALSMWLWGGMLYIWMIALIFYRYTFFQFSPGDLAPPYWINMGAMAISTLAGAKLIENTADAPYLSSLLPFLKGFTVLYWATGSWWIPMLLVLGIWRHVFRRFPLRYDPLYWGAVFPLGMYTAATAEMARTMELDFLRPLPQAFIYVALLAWCLAFFGLLLRIGKGLKRQPYLAV